MFPQQKWLDMLFVNLRMEPACLKENFNIKWVAEEGLIENIAQVITEYKQTRGLLVMLGIYYFKLPFSLIPNRNGYINTSLILISKNTWKMDIDAK